MPRPPSLPFSFIARAWRLDWITLAYHMITRGFLAFSTHGLVLPLLSSAMPCCSLACSAKPQLTQDARSEAGVSRQQRSV